MGTLAFSSTWSAKERVVTVERESEERKLIRKEARRIEEVINELREIKETWRSW